MSKQPERKCGTCRHLAVPPDRSGRIVPRAANAYRCTYAVVWPALPDAITDSRGGVALLERFRRHMEPRDGVTCPTWEARGVIGNPTPSQESAKQLTS